MNNGCLGNRKEDSGNTMEDNIWQSVAHVDYFDLDGQKKAATSAELRQQVEKARRIQQERFKEEENVFCNAQMTTTMIQKYCKLDETCTKLLKKASDEYGYSARVIHKLLRMARTSADLDESEVIRREDVIRVLSCRDLDVSNSRMYAIK